MFEGYRFRPSVLRAPIDINLRRAREQIAGIRERIATGTFSFADEFPNFRDLKSVPDSGSRKTCGQVFDEFLAHCESRRGKHDLAPITVATYRRVLDAFWRPKIGGAPFLNVTVPTITPARAATTMTDRLPYRGLALNLALGNTGGERGIRTGFGMFSESKTY
jgi:hypothetical protein